jgi:hypothetical protein
MTAKMLYQPTLNKFAERIRESEREKLARRIRLAFVALAVVIVAIGGVASYVFLAAPTGIQLTPTSPLTAYHSSDYYSIAHWSSSWYHNGSFWAAPAGELQGKLYANFAMNVIWYRSDNRNFTQPVTISGVRLDAVSSPLSNSYPGPSTPWSIWPSGLIFPSEGYWKVTGVAGNLYLTFVVYVYPHASCPSAICLV